MLNRIKDALGIKRKFTLSVYSFGYMSNVCHYADLDVVNSLNYLERINLNEMVQNKINMNHFNAPRIETVIKQDKG
jgi:hypothetical protein